MSEDTAIPGLLNNVIRIDDERIGRHEAVLIAVVDSAAHVDQRCIVLLVAGESELRNRIRIRDRRAIDIDPASERLEVRDQGWP